MIRVPTFLKQPPILPNPPFYGKNLKPPFLGKLLKLKPPCFCKGRISTMYTISKITDALLYIYMLMLVQKKNHGPAILITWIRVWQNFLSSDKRYGFPQPVGTFCIKITFYFYIPSIKRGTFPAMYHQFIHINHSY